MRFKEFLLREDTSYMTLEQGLESIKDHCHRFLSDVRGTDQWLYRGMKIPVVDSVIRMEHMKERQPRDSSGGYNVFFNTGIELALDIPMVRARSVFTTGNSSDASDYGNVYFTFPQGDYKYIWSPDIGDSYISDNRIIDRFTMVLHAEASSVPIITAQSMQEIFSNILQRSGDNVNRAVMNMKTNDVLVEEAFADFDIEVTAEQVEKALTKTFEPMYYDNEIREAIHGGHEIMIYESGGNIFIPRDLIQSHIETTGLKGSPEDFLSDYFWTPSA